MGLTRKVLDLKNYESIDIKVIISRDQYRRDIRPCSAVATVQKIGSLYTFLYGSASLKVSELVIMQLGAEKCFEEVRRLRGA